MKELRSLPHRVSLGVSGGDAGGGGGGGPELVGFFGFGGRYAVLGDIDPLNKAPF